MSFKRQTKKKKRNFFKKTTRKLLETRNDYAPLCRLVLSNANFNK